MQPGSLVVYIGGLSEWDNQAGYDLDSDTIYQIDKIGKPSTNDPILYEQLKGQKVLSLVEMPGIIYLVRLFREVQPPDEVDIEELMRQEEPKPEVKTFSEQLFKSSNN